MHALLYRLALGYHTAKNTLIGFICWCYRAKVFITLGSWWADGGTVWSLVLKFCHTETHVCAGCIKILRRLQWWCSICVLLSDGLHDLKSQIPKMNLYVAAFNVYISYTVIVNKPASLYTFFTFFTRHFLVMSSPWEHGTVCVLRASPVRKRACFPIRPRAFGSLQI